MLGSRTLARSGEGGQSLPLIIMMFVVLCGFVGMTIDVGFGLLQKRRLQAAVDLGLISGAQDMPNATIAASTAGTFTRNNFALASNQTVAVSTSTGCMVAGCATPDRLTLNASTMTPTFFLGLFGVDNWAVAARGSACGPCDSSPVSYDVIVILDRSYSMCTSASGASNGCADLAAAKQGIHELLAFFDDDTDRVGLTVLSSADTTGCTVAANNCRSTDAAGRPFSRSNTLNGAFNRLTGAPTSGCNDSMIYNDLYLQGSTSYSNRRFYRTAGDFMDGTAGSHDRWNLVPLAQGTNFKNANGSLNLASPLLTTVTCLQPKLWTPISAAMYEATEEMRLNGRTVDSDGNEVYQAIIYFGDGGATAIPARRTDTGTLAGGNSWYTPLAALPCADAVARAQRAWTNYSINIYTIGYALNEGSASECWRNTATLTDIDYTRTAQSTIEDMAQGDGTFQEANASNVDETFAQIGHAITAGGTRLVD